MDQTLADLAALGYRPAPFRKGLERIQKMLDAPAPVIESMDASLRNTVLYRDTDGREYWVVYLWAARSPWLPPDRETFNAAVRPVLGDATPLLSVYHLPDHQAGVVRKDLNVVGGLAAAAVVLITVLSLGRLRDGLLALVPVTIATGITLAACAFMGGAVKSMNLAAIPIVLGIGVDGGIHYLAALRARGKGPVDALGDMGPGYWAASVTTILGFGSIAFSSTPGLSFLGVLVIVGMTVSMAATLFVLPAIAGRRER
jgi:hypothetical protein